jgi:UDP-3-O-[3-hydroxymyristoyl] glucosamine N-acyltransferase
MNKKNTIMSIVDKIESEGHIAMVENQRDIELKHIAYYKTAGKNSLCFYAGNDYSEISHLKECVIICNNNIDQCPESVTCIKTPNPQLVFYIIAKEMFKTKKTGRVHPTAIISSNSIIHPTASIGPFCVIDESTIGEGAVLHSNIHVYSKSIIGNRTIIESNTCIGATGVVWVWGNDGNMRDMPQFGGAIIGNDCFIGSNVTIVKGSFHNTNTTIDDQCKIAHGSMIGHDCQIGEKTHLANNVALGGSVKIGMKCFIGSGVNFRAKAQIGDNIIVGVGSTIIHDFLENGLVLIGSPAHPTKKKISPAGLPKPLDVVDKV